MLQDGQVCHLLLAPDLMFGVYFRLGSRLWLFLYTLWLVFLTDLGLDLGIGTSYFLLFALAADLTRAKHTALIGVFDDIRVFLACYELLQGHHGSIVEHASNYIFK